ncbi:MAG: L-seryl-tRNA(Sec) selenium transferase [Syntrophales bacterium]|jgi:L-seryl-tRNA(Ser) seleniumtransferase|nr:L-seryl-tRNA(Sec) selenium transferase [Syntrophales bacterium]MCK9527530.1 L-seryl-tRNA(Sec) selenium transferase [Syntrophales bacterium]MDX9922587.1 L-seryl-tRNA(Sec) selenium transferase [Syntrophales bacterium]
MDDAQRLLLKELPKIDEILALLEKNDDAATLPRSLLVDACRHAVDGMRREIFDSAGVMDKRPGVDRAVAMAEERIRSLREPSIRRVINATGILLHTNLGRAPLCREALEEIVSISRGYSNLEFDLSTGRRGLRYDHVSEILRVLTGAEEAIVVNNNAAAVLLVLNSLSFGKEAIVSRGELIEIGGEFRIPEVMEKSGALLREVGSTNRTHLYDYENAIDPETTGMILKVHTSNFRTVGFTGEVEPAVLVELGRRHGIPLMNDLGSGCLLDLGRFGLGREPTVQDAVKSGADVITFSGDKLLGGPQAGIILGRRPVMEKIRKNPLNRALRIDKLTLGALEATLAQYLFSKNPEDHIPVLRFMTEPVDSVHHRAEELFRRLAGIGDSRFSFTTGPDVSFAGGGSLPTQEFPTRVVTVQAGHLTAHEMERRLRRGDPPVIGRIQDEKVVLDARALADDEVDIIERVFRHIAAG